MSVIADGGPPATAPQFVVVRPFAPPDPGPAAVSAVGAGLQGTRAGAGIVRKVAAGVFAMLGVLAGPATVAFPRPMPPDPHEFPLMVWDETPDDSAVLAGMADAGLTVAGLCAPSQLATVRAAGLTCIVTDPALRAIDYDAPPPEPAIRAAVERLAPALRQDPAALAVFLSDEPQQRELAALGRVATLVRARLQGMPVFVNLFPFRNGQREWYRDYADYVAALVRELHPSMLSFDNYSLSYAGMGDEFYSNLELVRSAALAGQIPFWSCVQSVAHFGYLEPSDATLHLQVYAALAYGARGLEYFTYATPERGNYRSGALDPFGHLTPTWEMLRRINLEVAALAPTLLGLESTGVYHYPDVPAHGTALERSPLVAGIDMSKDEDAFVPPSVAARFLVGEFRDPRDRKYLMIVNKDLVYSFRFDVRLRLPGASIVRVSPYTGAEEPLDGEQPWLAPGGGVLLRVSWPP